MGTVRHLQPWPRKSRSIRCGCPTSGPVASARAPDPGVITVTGSFRNVQRFLAVDAGCRGCRRGTTTPVGATGSPSPQSGVTSFGAPHSAQHLRLTPVVFSNYTRDATLAGWPPVHRTNQFDHSNDQYDNGWAQQLFVAAYKKEQCST